MTVRINPPQEILDYCSQNGSYKIVKHKNLKKYGTSCGAIGNKPFTDEVVEYLKALAYQWVIIEIDTEDPLLIANMSVRWKKPLDSISKAFAWHVDYNDGSLRPDLYFIKGWDTYESE